MEGETEHLSSMHQQGQRGGPGDDGTSLHSSQYNTLHSHSGHGQSLGHSVVPDLMKIYESLTQSKTPQTQHHQQHGEPQYQQQPPSTDPHPPQHAYQGNNYYPPAPAPAPPYPYMQAHSQPYNYAQQSEMPAPQPQPYPSADFEELPATNQRTTSGRSLRKRTADKVEDDRSSSDGSSTRSRKKKKSDGRWSKRFTWPEELHRDFVSAIFDVGLKHASPSALLEHMPDHDQITSERVKSHLQKYRLHRAKSKKEFMSCYEATLNNYLKSGVNSKSLGSAEAAAHLAYSTMNEPQEVPSAAPEQGQPNSVQDSHHEMTGTSRGGALVLPKLTEAEKKSPMGASMGYLMGLFFSLRQQLLANRAASQSVVDGTDPSEHQGGSNNVPLVSYPNSADTEHGDHEGQFHDQGVASWPAPSGHSEPIQYQDQHVAPPAVASKPSAAAAHLSQASSSRTNLEESHMMKREMQSQMAFQNKMRALKQQELNKTKNMSNGSDHHHHGHHSAATDDIGDGHSDDRGRLNHHDEESAQDGAAQDHDGAFPATGESAEQDGNGQPGGASSTRAGRSRGVSVGASEEFWVNDEQLFEFLMNS